MTQDSPYFRRAWLTTTETGRWLVWMLVIWGLVLASLVGADGSSVWRFGRVVIVIIVIAVTLFLLVRFHRPGAALAVFYGCAGLTIAVAFGFDYLIKDGLSWRVVLGLIDLVAGLMLIILGGIRLLSGMRRRWLFITVPALVVAATLLTWIITPAVIATNVPPIAAGEQTPLDFGLFAREVRFTASDGVELGGWYIPSSNRAAVVLRHGSGSTSADVIAHAIVLAAHGYGVLLTDARGHGRSDGRAMDFGWYGNADIAGAVSYLAGQTGIDAGRIGVVGESMGGEEALGATAEDKRIAAVVAEGVTGRTDADKAWIPDVFGIPGRIQLVIEWAQYSIADVLTGASKPVALAEAARMASPRPVLLIAAGEVEDEQYTAAYIQKQAPLSVFIWTVPGSGHTGGLSTAPVEWEVTVIGFLDRALLS
jgi:uncharacterized protein